MNRQRILKPVSFCMTLVVMAFFGLATGQVIAQPPARSDHTEPWILDSKLQQRIDRVVAEEMEQQDLVGVAIGVIEGGQVVYVQGYGWADREAKVALEVTTVMNWASNSKPIGAVIAAQLVHEGLLDLDVDIRTYLPDFPDKGHVITTRQLLCHQSGMPHYSNGKIVRGPPLTTRFSNQVEQLGGPARSNAAEAIEQDLPDWDPANAVARFIHSPLIHTPGEVEDYSSYAYVLLTAVLQAAGQESWHRQVARRITEPGQLKSLQADIPLQDPPIVEQLLWSRGYRRLTSGEVQRIPDVAHYWKHAAGGYKSNALDFSRWAAALLGNELMDAESKRVFWQPQVMTGGKVGSYGLGFAVDGIERNLRVAHGGSQDETKTRMVLYPEQGRGVVVMSNCNHADPGKISTAILGVLR